jgi:hypothetical protein
MNWMEWILVLLLGWLVLKIATFQRKKDQHFTEALVLAYSRPRSVTAVSWSLVAPIKVSFPDRPCTSFVLDYSTAEIKFCAMWWNQGSAFQPDFVDVLITSSNGFLRIREEAGKLLYARNKIKLKHVSEEDYAMVENIITAVEDNIIEENFEIRPRQYVVAS